MTARRTPTDIPVLDGWEPVLVHWEAWWDDERDRTTEVVRSCKRCYPARALAEKMTQGRNGLVPLVVMLVSPQGVAHQAERGDTTDCGRDCTGPDWWHRS